VSPRAGGADFLDNAHRFVAEDVSGAQVWAEGLVEVHVGTTYASRGDTADGVGRFLDHGIGNGVDGCVATALPVTARIVYDL